MKFFLSKDAKQKGIVPLEAPRAGDAGYDLRGMDDLDIPPGQQVIIRTGLHVAIPEGWVGVLKDRSSLAKQRIYTRAGVIDSSYKGEILVLLENQGTSEFHIKPNDRVAQMIVLPHYSQAVDQVDNMELLGNSSRGEDGFGSTGL